jgi:hypothetical protein
MIGGLNSLTRYRSSPTARTPRPTAAAVSAAPLGTCAPVGSPAHASLRHSPVTRVPGTTEHTGFKLPIVLFAADAVSAEAFPILSKA